MQVSHATIGIMTSGELGSRPAKAAPGWAAWVTSPQALIFATAALLLTNVPLTRYRSGDQPDYFWSSLSVLLTAWQLWGRRRFAWFVLTAAAAAALPIYALSVTGVINYVLPGRWMLITGPADMLALVILLSPPVRRWVAKRPPPVLLTAWRRAAWRYRRRHELAVDGSGHPDGRAVPD
jgi:hypothetical protein